MCAAPRPRRGAALRPVLFELLNEIAELERRMSACEQQLAALTREDPVIAQLLKIPGIGPLTATAMRAAVVDVQRFASGRHFASWNRPHRARTLQRQLPPSRPHR